MMGKPYCVIGVISVTTRPVRGEFSVFVGVKENKTHRNYCEACTRHFSYRSIHPVNLLDSKFSTDSPSSHGTSDSTVRLSRGVIFQVPLIDHAVFMCDALSDVERVLRISHKTSTTSRRQS